MPFLLQNMKGKSRDNIKSLLKNKRVFINGEPVTQYNYGLQPGDKVGTRWEASETGYMNRHLSIVFEDDHIIVIDKFAGLLSIATDNGKGDTAYSLLSTYVKQVNRAGKIFIVHRLDRDTSGLMMFARSEKVQNLLQKDWKNNVSERTYTALVEGKVEVPDGVIKSYIYESKSLMMHSSHNPSRGDLAVTRFKTLKSNDDYSLLEISLETGKKNQIRLHMQEIGHSIAGDKKYGAVGNPLGRLGLHASVLAFKHPITGELLRFESKIPARFRRVI